MGLKIDLSGIKPLVQDLLSSDDDKPKVAAAPIAAAPTGPPAPLPPTPAPAGFTPWLDGGNLQKIQEGITLPGQPLLPDAMNAPVNDSLFGGPAQKPQPLNLNAIPPSGAPPADMSKIRRLSDPEPGSIAAVKPIEGWGAPPAAAAPAATVAAAQPAAAAPGPLLPFQGPVTPSQNPGPPRMPTMQEDMTAHPDQYQHQSRSGWRGALEEGIPAALVSLGAGLRGGDPTAGLAMINRQQDIDRGVPAANAQQYDIRNVKPLRDAAALAKTQADAAYSVARPGIEQSKINQKQTAAQAKISQLAAAHGQTATFDEDGGPTFADDPNSQAYKDRVALTSMHEATRDRDAITSEIQKNHYVQGTPEFAEQQRKLSQVDERLKVAMSGLGLRAQGLKLREQNTNAALYGTDLAGNELPGATEITDDDGNMTTVGSKNAGHAIDQQKTVGSFKDLKGSVATSRKALQDFFGEGGSLSDTRIIQAMSDPTSMIGKVVNGKMVQGGLSPNAIKAINAVRQLHEQAGILRSTTGGTASEAGAQRILDTVPVAGDANEMALDKLNQQEAVLARLAPGQTTVAGGLKVTPKGGKPAADMSRMAGAPATYKQTATGPNGKIGSNDGGQTWFEVKSGKKVR